LPALAPSSRPDERRDWFINSLEMTMLKIRPGPFVRRDQVKDSKEQTVKVTRAFYLCDREVTHRQFLEFVNDPTCPNEEKPADWQDQQTADEAGAKPQANVNWFDAVLFCNWLSRKERLLPCYERTGKKEKSRDPFKYQEVENDRWRLAASGTGYRLPT